MEKDKISVIIPVYNVEKYLAECMDSILHQTYHNLEILLIDDGSTDSSGQICDDYAAIDKRIIVIHKSNGGLSDARNEGLKYVTGEYLTFVDSDDIVEYRFLEKLYYELNAVAADIAICHVEAFVEKKPEESCQHVCLTEYRGTDMLLRSYLKGTLRPMAWGKLYRICV